MRKSRDVKFNMINELKMLKQKKSIIWAICLVIIVLSIVVLIFTIINRPKEPPKTTAEQVEEFNNLYNDAVIGSEGEVVTYSKPELKDLISVGQLQTLSYSYNSIKKVRVDHEVRYYVAYEGNVQLGIDFQDILYDIDDSANSITVTLPPIQITNSEVIAESLDYMFVDNSYNTPDLFREAYIMCEEDLVECVNDDDTLINLARINTEGEIGALIRPFIQEFYPEYTMTIVWEDNETSNEADFIVDETNPSNTPSSIEEEVS